MTSNQAILWRISSGELILVGDAKVLYMRQLEMTAAADEDTAYCTLEGMTEEGFDPERAKDPIECEYRLQFSRHMRAITPRAIGHRHAETP